MTSRSINFSSDNCAGFSPQALEALVAADQVPSSESYFGQDIFTLYMKAEVKNVFEKDDLECFLVSTGTAANCLAIAQLLRATPSSQQTVANILICSETSHVFREECGAAEFFSDGVLSLRPLPSREGKLEIGTLNSFFEEHNGSDGFQRMMNPKILSIANCTELGTVYTPKETSSLAKCAHGNGVLVSTLR